MDDDETQCTVYVCTMFKMSFELDATFIVLMSVVSASKFTGTATFSNYLRKSFLSKQSG